MLTDFEQIKTDSHFSNFDTNINFTTKLSYEKLDAWATFWAAYQWHPYSTLASQIWEGFQQLWTLPWLLTIVYFSLLFLTGQSSIIFFQLFPNTAS